MTVPDSVRYGNTNIDFTVRRSPRRKKTMQSHHRWRGRASGPRP